MNDICSIDNNYFNKFTHELKNPLTVCNGYLNMILKGNKEDQETYLEIVRDELKRSINIINNYNTLLNLNKMNINLYDLLTDVNNIVNRLYNCKIIIIGNTTLNYYGDYDKLKQVFINLIKNSYEAKTNNKLLIVINIKDYNNKYKISFIDNGKGISKKDLDKIYEDYYTTKKKGRGLGVPYIIDIINLHSGSIKYYSREGLGTKVVMTLPK